MSVIIKSNPVRVGGAKSLQDHLLELRDNDEVPNVLFGDPEAILVNDDVSSFIGNKHGNMHFQISIKADVSNDFLFDLVTDIKRDYHASDRSHVLIEHQKQRADGSEDRHFHLVLPYTSESGKALNTSWNYARNEKLSRAAELLLGIELTKGRFNRSVSKELGIDLPEINEGELHSSRTFGSKAHQKAKRLGIDLAELRGNILRGNNNNEINKSISEQSEREGFTVKKGDRRDVVIIEKNGEAIELNKILNIKRGEQSERFVEQFEQYKRQINSGYVFQDDEGKDFGERRISHRDQGNIGRDPDAVGSQQPQRRDAGSVHGNDRADVSVNNKPEQNGRTGRAETLNTLRSPSNAVSSNHTEQRRDNLSSSDARITNIIIRSRFRNALNRSSARLSDVQNIANYPSYDAGSIDAPLDVNDPYFLQKWSEQQRKNLGFIR